MTAQIIRFPVSRIVAIPPAVQQCPDVRVEFARRVERAFFSQYESRMSGDTKPCDSGDAA